MNQSISSYSHSFAKLFWGVVLVVFDLTIKGIDLLADGFGYLLIAAGCGGLVAYSPKFRLAGVFCFVQFVVWGLELLANREKINLFRHANFGLDCVLIWVLLGGIVEFAIAGQRAKLATDASKSRVIFVSISVVSLFLSWSVGATHRNNPFIPFLFFGMLFSSLFVLKVIHRANVELMRR